MDNFEKIINGIIAIVSALSGAGVFVGVRQMLAAARERKSAADVSMDGHAETQKLLHEVHESMLQQLAVAQQAHCDAEEEAAQLRKERDKLLETVYQLEAKNNLLEAALENQGE